MIEKEGVQKLENLKDEIKKELEKKELLEEETESMFREGHNELRVINQNVYKYYYINSYNFDKDKGNIREINENFDRLIEYFEKENFYDENIINEIKERREKDMNKIKNSKIEENNESSL